MQCAVIRDQAQVIKLTFDLDLIIQKGSETKITSELVYVLQPLLSLRAEFNGSQNTQNKYAFWHQSNYLQKKRNHSVSNQFCCVEMLSTYRIKCPFQHIIFMPFSNPRFNTTSKCMNSFFSASSFKIQSQDHLQQNGSVHSVLCYTMIYQYMY